MVSASCDVFVEGLALLATSLTAAGSGLLLLTTSPGTKKRGRGTGASATAIVSERDCGDEAGEEL